MWTQIIRLLEIKHKSDADAAEFERNLTTLNDWIIREYSRTNLTCEELELAYNALVKEELTKAEGKVLDAYPVLNARHVGEVIAAYRRKVDGDGEVSRVLSEGLYLPIPAELSPEQLDAQLDALMEQNLAAALKVTRNGVAYFDLGNGLYTWLFNKGRISPTDAEWEAALETAQVTVRASLVNQQQQAGQLAGFRPTTDKRGKRDKRDTTTGFQPLRAVIKKRLIEVINEDGGYKKRVRQEAYRICLADWLCVQVGVTGPLTAHLPTTPNLPVSDPDVQKPFSHRDYVESLKEQLPTMGDEQLSDLQGASRQRNVLDVFELTSAEWNRRQARQHPVPPKKQPNKQAKN